MLMALFANVQPYQHYRLHLCINDHYFVSRSPMGQTKYNTELVTYPFHLQQAVVDKLSVDLGLFGVPFCNFDAEHARWSMLATHNRASFYHERPKVLIAALIAKLETGDLWTHDPKATDPDTNEVAGLLQEQDARLITSFFLRNK